MLSTRDHPGPGGVRLRSLRALGAARPFQTALPRKTCGGGARDPSLGEKVDRDLRVCVCSGPARPPAYTHTQMSPHRRPRGVLGVERAGSTGGRHSRAARASSGRLSTQPSTLGPSGDESGPRGSFLFPLASPTNRHQRRLRRTLRERPSGLEIERGRRGRGRGRRGSPAAERGPGPLLRAAPSAGPVTRRPRISTPARTGRGEGPNDPARGDGAGACAPWDLWAGEGRSRRHDEVRGPPAGKGRWPRGATGERPSLLPRELNVVSPFAAKAGRTVGARVCVGRGRPSEWTQDFRQLRCTSAKPLAPESGPSGSGRRAAGAGERRQGAAARGREPGGGGRRAAGAPRVAQSRAGAPRGTAGRAAAATPRTESDPPGAPACRRPAPRPERRGRRPPCRFRRRSAPHKAATAPRRFPTPRRRSGRPRRSSLRPPRRRVPRTEGRAPRTEVGLEARLPRRDESQTPLRCACLRSGEARRPSPPRRSPRRRLAAVSSTGPRGRLASETSAGAGPLTVLRPCSPRAPLPRHLAPRTPARRRRGAPPPRAPRAPGRRARVARAASRRARRVGGGRSADGEARERGRRASARVEAGGPGRVQWAEGAGSLPSSSGTGPGPRTSGGVERPRPQRRPPPPATRVVPAVASAPEDVGGRGRGQRRARGGTLSELSPASDPNLAARGGLPQRSHWPTVRFGKLQGWANAPAGHLGLSMKPLPRRGFFLTHPRVPRPRRAFQRTPPRLGAPGASSQTGSQRMLPEETSRRARRRNYFSGARPSLEAAKTGLGSLRARIRGLMGCQGVAGRVDDGPVRERGLLSDLSRSLRPGGPERWPQSDEGRVRS